MSNKEDIQLVILRRVNNLYEFNLIKAILDDNEIPYIVKDHGIGGYMRIISGDSPYGTDILVDEATFERANELLKEIVIDQ